MNKIMCGDALKCLAELPSESVQMCVTSPPYYGLRDYGVDGQLGNEQSPFEYIHNLVEIFREVKRVLKKDGTLWINIADSYAGSGKGIVDTPISERPTKIQPQYYEKTGSYYGMPKTWERIKAKDMIGIPWLLAFALRDDGWYLRSDIIWHKTNCMPESVKDRPSKCYEHIFLLSKSPKYYYDYKAIKEPVADSTLLRNQRAVSDKNKYAVGAENSKIGKQALFAPRSFTIEYTTRNKRDIWACSTNSYKANGHYAIYPEKLIEPCILAGCPVGGVVLDTFFGSGTTGAVAKRLGRQYIGIDLNPDYCELAQKRIDETEVMTFGNTN